MKAWLWILLVAVALYGLHRLACWAEDRGWIYYRKKGSPGSAGSAMLEIQSLIEPEKRHMVEQVRKIEVEEGEPGDPPKPDADEPGRSS